MNFYSIFNQVLLLFLIIVAGYVGRKWNIYDDAVTKGITGIIVKITLPALLINAIGKDFSRELLGGSIQMMGISIGIYVFSMGIAFMAPYFLRTNKRDLGVYQFMLMFSNVGFMGFPVIKAIFGETALFYAAIYNTVLNFFVFTIGIMFLTQDQKEKQGFSFKVFFNPAIISAVTGLLIFLFSIELPQALKGALTMLGDTTTPLSMLVIGGVLAGMETKENWKEWRIYVVCFIRLIGLPLLVYGILSPFIHNMDILATAVMITAMPSASMVTILANQYGGNDRLASQGVFISTLLSVITIPILGLLFV